MNNHLRRRLAATLLAAVALSGAAGARDGGGNVRGDRFLEVSLRGLYPPSPPLAAFSLGVLGDCAGALAQWTWRADATLSPAGAAGLCLDVSLAAPAAEGGILSAPPFPGAPAMLRPCNASLPTQQWVAQSPPPASAAAAAAAAAAAGPPWLVASRSSWGAVALCLSALNDGSGAVGVVDCAAAETWLVSAGQTLTLASGREPGQCVAPGGRDLASQAAFALQMLAPVLAPTTGRVGLILDLGWLIDIVTEFQGRANQAYPIDTEMNTQWANATYGDLAALVRSLRSAAAAAGLGDVTIGLLMVGWAHIYSVGEGPFGARHGEIYSDHSSHYFIAFAEANGPGLVADTYPYAAYPSGVTAGTPFSTFFGAQFAKTADFLGLDAVVIRDGFSTYSNYNPRGGPFGETASTDPSQNEAWFSAFAATFSAIKRARPSTFVMGYSSAASAVSEMRIGLMDLERVVAEGFIDAWIDQSWAGAWQDVADRKSLMLGWTFQLQYIIAHRAAIAGGNAVRVRAGTAPCLHYSLTETFDSYEIWSTIRDVPGKLAWGIWAFNVAALRTGGAGALKASDGAYVSWSWSWSQNWLTTANASFLIAHLDGAQAAAATLEAVYGPTVLYNRAMLEAVQASAPAGTVGEWVDEQAAMLSKFCTGVLAVQRVEGGDFDPDARDGYLVQVPRSLSPAAAATLSAAAAAGTPLVLLGRAAAFDDAALAAAGLQRAAAPDDAQLPRGLYSASFSAAALAILPSLPPSVTLSLANSSGAALLPGTQLLAALADARAPSLPLATLAGASLWLHAPDRQAGGGSDLSLAIAGSAAPYELASAALAGLHAARNVSRVLPETCGAQSPASVALFRSGGTLKVLVGNLESLNVGPSGPVINASSATPRAPTLVLRLDHVGVPAAQRLPGACWQLTEVVAAEGAPSRGLADASGDEVRFDIHIGVHGGRVLELGGC